MTHCRIQLPGNSDIDISSITEKMKISRTKLYYKTKGLTGENPSVLFKRYKLNRAAQLLREHKYNMSEIADKTGFSTLSHFSTSFKKQFTPRAVVCLNNPPRGPGPGGEMPPGPIKGYTSSKRLANLAR